MVSARSHLLAVRQRFGFGSKRLDVCERESVGTLPNHLTIILGIFAVIQLERTARRIGGQQGQGGGGPNEPLHQLASAQAAYFC